MNSFDLNNLNFVNLIKVYDIYISGKETRIRSCSSPWLRRIRLRFRQRSNGFITKIVWIFF